MAEEPKGQGGGAQLASATHLAYFMPMAIVVGMLVGRWIGGKFGHPQGGLMWGFAWGLATAFYEAFKVQKSLGGAVDPRVDPVPELKGALAVLFPGLLLFWFLKRGWVGAGVFLALGLFSLASVAFTVWRVRKGRKAASALVGLGNLALLGLLARAIMERFPEETLPLLSGMLMHIPALFWAAFRVWWKQNRTPS